MLFKTAVFCYFSTSLTPNVLSFGLVEKDDFYGNSHLKEEKLSFILMTIEPYYRYIMPFLVKQKILNFL